MPTYVRAKQWLRSTTTGGKPADCPLSLQHDDCKRKLKSKCENKSSGCFPPFTLPPREIQKRFKKQTADSRWKLKSKCPHPAYPLSNVDLNPDSAHEVLFYSRP